MPKPYADPAHKAWPFLAIFVVVGLSLLTPFVLQAIRDFRIARIYVPAQCQITGRRAVTSTSRSLLGGRWVESNHSHTEFTWTYEVAGRYFTAEGYDNHDGIMADPQETGNITEGDRRECWIDPTALEKSVLVRHFRAKFYLGALIPGAFILIGGVMLRGVLRRKPQLPSISHSRGSRLAVRLEPVLSTKGITGCLGTVILILGLFIILGLPRIGGGVTLFLICAAIEGFLIYHLARAIRAARVPDPVVEINDEPLAPGQTTQYFICQPGPARLASFQVQIICEKIGEHGTRVAHKQLLVERDALVVGREEEFSGTFTLPEKASPSMKTVQTATNWCVRIRRKLASGMNYDTDYPFGVIASPDGQG